VIKANAKCGHKLVSIAILLEQDVLALELGLVQLVGICANDALAAVLQERQEHEQPLVQLRIVSKVLLIVRSWLIVITHSEDVHQVKIWFYQWYFFYVFPFEIVTAWLS